MGHSASEVTRPESILGENSVVNLSPHSKGDLIGLEQIFGSRLLLELNVYLRLHHELKAVDLLVITRSLGDGSLRLELVKSFQLDSIKLFLVIRLLHQSSK